MTDDMKISQHERITTARRSYGPGLTGRDATDDEMMWVHFGAGFIVGCLSTIATALLVWVILT